MTWRTQDLSIQLRTTSSQQGYQKATFTVTHGAFSAARDSWLDAGDIERFAVQLDEMWRKLSGEAELYGEHGSDFSFRLTMKSGGHIGVLIEIAQPTARLVVETQTDQTFLPALRDNILSVA
jgi:hypothetical protein